MNYAFITKPLPYPFKLIGYTLFLLTIGAALTEKLSMHILPDGISLDLLQATFLLALLIILISKGRIEDERSSEIRMVVTSYGFYLVVFFLIFSNFIQVTTFTTIPSIRIYAMTVIHMEIVVLIHEIFSRTGLLNLMLQHKKYLRYYAVLAFVPVPFLLSGLLKLNRWIWAWETLGG